LNRFQRFNRWLLDLASGLFAFFVMSIFFTILVVWDLCFGKEEELLEED
jgi:hypothetical protein